MQDTIKLPSVPDETVYLISGDNIVFVTISYDHNADNPCTCFDGVGSIRSFSPKHINSIDIDEAKELLNTDWDVVPLSYFEHGNCLWTVEGSAQPAGVEFRWDGVQFAGIWIPDKSVRESYRGQDGLDRRDWMIRQAASACEQYTEWANGEVYQYDVQSFKKRLSGSGEVFDKLSDYRYETPIFEESISGLYGWEEAQSEVEAIVKFRVMM